MNKGTKYYTRPIVGALIIFTLLLAQGSGYLSQKLMVENNIRDRVKEALSKVIDSHKYVINVDVELEILDEVNEQNTVFALILSKVPKALRSNLTKWHEWKNTDLMLRMHLIL